MKVEDINKPCEHCVHAHRCPIIHPELQRPDNTLERCEQLEKYSRYMSYTRSSTSFERW